MLLAPSGASADPASRPVPGSPGVGDRLFPELGNGGYDVDHYTLDLSYDGVDLRDIDGAVHIRARADRALRRFNLDFKGGSVERVLVDRVEADWDREEEELVIWPARNLRDGRRFSVDVTYRPDAPAPEDPRAPGMAAWLQTADGSVTAGQPYPTHFIFPSNDHPSDKATYTFRLDVPAGTTAVANGVLTGKVEQAGRTHWRYEERDPMASHVVQLAVGDFTVVSRPAAGGVPLRDVVPSRLAAQLDPSLATEAAHMAFMQSRVGPYPFDVYGTLVAEGSSVLETPTLSFFPAFAFRVLRRSDWEPVMVHVLAHSWFGDSVTVELWRDLWLNEGHVTWYEREFAAEQGFIDFDGFMRGLYEQGDQFRAEFGPVARPLSARPDQLLGPNVFEGGALVLYALRQEVGDATFRRIERSWVQRYANDIAGTQDFIRHASQVAGRDLRGFLRAWLYGTRTPPMPGHPDWTVVRVEPGAEALPEPQADMPLARY